MCQNWVRQNFAALVVTNYPLEYRYVPVAIMLKYINLYTKITGSDLRKDA